MEITLETVEKNTEQYNANIQKLLQERAELMKKVAELRRKREQLEDGLEIAELDFEESKLVQQINDLTYTYRGNKLTLEQLGLQKDVLEMKIDRQAYSDGMVANRKAKVDLSKEQEVTYCENEVTKCEKALELYTLIGDNDNITKWQQALESAKKDLEYARQEIEKDKKPKEEQDKKVEEEKQPDRTDTEGQEQEGYSYEEEGRTVKEEQQQVLKDYSGQEIGNRTITWNTDLENGTTEIETEGQLENDDGKYSMKETTRGVGDEIQLQRKEMTRDNKQTGQKEQYVYQRDDKGNEMYYRTANGKLTYKMTKNERGITIDTYDNGQLTGSYEYDKDGKAIDGLPRNR